MNYNLRIIIIAISILAIIRIILPFLVKDYVNNVIDGMEGYSGRVEDVDLNLYRGAYVIKGIKIEKEADNDTIPFVDVQKVDLSVEWNALFNGAIVGEIILINPEINFVADPEEEEPAEEDTANWVETIKDLIPLQINRFEARNGKISFKNLHTSPQVDIFVDSLYLVALNISNVESEEEDLPASIRLSGTSIGGGRLNVDLKSNFLKEIPDIDGNLSFENIALTAFNDFTQAYGNFDLEAGRLSLYSEIVIDNGIVNGYFKPLFEGIEVVDKEDREESSFFQTVWEGLVGLFSESLENQPRDQVATRIPISGDLNNPDAKILETVFNIFRNAFIDAFEKNVEGSVSFGEQNPDGR